MKTIICRYDRFVDILSALPADAVNRALEEPVDLSLTVSFRDEIWNTHRGIDIDIDIATAVDNGIAIIIDIDNGIDIDLDTDVGVDIDIDIDCATDTLFC